MDMEFELQDTDNKFNNEAYQGIELLADRGRFHQFRTFFIINSVNILFASQIFIMGFIATPAEFSCHVNESTIGLKYMVIDSCTWMDENERINQCGEDSNSYFLFNETSNYSSLNSEFRLVCSRKYLANISFSIFVLGGLLTTPIATQISDIYGRHHVYLGLLWSGAVLSLLCVLSPNYWIFLILRFLQGAGIMSATTVGYVYSCESVSIGFRSFMPIVAVWPWVAGTNLVGIFRLFFRSWRTLYLAISLPGLFTFSYFWLISESPQWIFHHKKIFRSQSTDVKCLDLLLTENITAEKNRKGRTRTFLDMVRNRAILFHLILNCFIFMGMNIVYWKLALTSVSLTGTLSFGYFFSSFIEIPSAMFSVLVLKSFGRRTVSTCSFMAQSVCLVAATFFQANFANLCFASQVLARFFNNLLWCSQPLLVTEMAPTSVRNLFVGLVDVFGEIGVMLAPYVELLDAYNECAPLLFLSLVSCISLILGFALPETKHRQMPDDIDDFDPGWLVNHFRGRVCNRPQQAQYLPC